MNIAEKTKQTTVIYRKGDLKKEKKLNKIKSLIILYEKTYTNEKVQKKEKKKQKRT